MSKHTQALPYVRSWLQRTRGEVLARLAEPPRDAELRLLVESAERAGVGGIVAEELQRMGIAPPWLQHKVVGWFAGSAQHFARLQQTGERLREAGLTAIALKGSFLAPTVYGRRWSCRPMSDLDLLVDPDAYVRARQITAPDGSTPITIDWHTDLVGAHRIASRARLCRLTGDEIWERSLPWLPGIRCLTAEMNFLQLSIHAAKHSYARLIWLVDLALLLPGCRLAGLLQFARERGAERPVLLALHLVERLEQTGVSHPRLRGYEAALCRFASARTYNDVAWGEFFLILSTPGLGDKVRYIEEYLWPGETGRVGWRQRAHRLARRAWGFLRNPGRTTGSDFAGGSS